MEEILSGETSDEHPTLISRAKGLLSQLRLEDHDDEAAGPSSAELASTVRLKLALPEIAALRLRFEPEFWIYAGTESDSVLTLTAGIADAVAFDASGPLGLVIDWKSDISPGAAVVKLYRAQVPANLAATGAATGLIVFMTSGHIERVPDA